jgi:hypothetical protein
VVSFQRDRIFLSATETGSRAHPGNEVVSSRAKRPGREADHSPPDSAEFMNLWRYNATPHNCML